MAGLRTRTVSPEQLRRRMHKDLATLGVLMRRDDELVAPTVRQHNLAAGHRQLYRWIESAITNWPEDSALRSLAADWQHRRRHMLAFTARLRRRGDIAVGV